EPFVTEIHALEPGYSDAHVLRLAASAEANLKHPSARAVVMAAQDRGIEIAPCAEMEYTMGMGVVGAIEGVRVCVGSERFMRARKIGLANSGVLAERHGIA